MDKRLVSFKQFKNLKLEEYINTLKLNHNFVAKSIGFSNTFVLSLWKLLLQADIEYLQSQEAQLLEPRSIFRARFLKNNQTEIAKKVVLEGKQLVIMEPLTRESLNY
ncbi:MAG: hypothetical protein WCK98_06790 [bacterium]